MDVSCHYRRLRCVRHSLQDCYCPLVFFQRRSAESELLRGECTGLVAHVEPRKAAGHSTKAIGTPRPLTHLLLTTFRPSSVSSHHPQHRKHRKHHPSSARRALCPLPSAPLLRRITIMELINHVRRLPHCDRSPPATFVRHPRPARSANTCCSIIRRHSAHPRRDPKS